MPPPTPSPKDPIFDKGDFSEILIIMGVLSFCLIAAIIETVVDIAK